MKKKIVAGFSCPVALITGLSFAVWDDYAFAQDGEALELEEVVVTARKRAESIQDVPIAVTAISGAQIERAFIPKIEGLDKMAPNVELGKMQFGGGGLTGSIRGVSFAETERTFEPAVGLTVDGVAYGTGTGAMVDMFDIASAEVLRGPQGTLFGRNTMGGTINLKRSKPTGELGVKASIGIGNYDTQELKLIVNAPIVEDVLALKLSAIDLSNELFTKNLFTGDNEDGLDQTTLGFKLLFTPSDNIEVLLSYDNVDDTSRYPGVVNLSQPGNTFCDLGIAGTLPPLTCQSDAEAFAASRGENFSDFQSEYSAEPFKSTIDSDIATLEINWDLNEQLTLTSITGYHDVSDRLTGEVTGIPDFPINGNNVPFFFVERKQTYEQFSQELRLVSDYDGSFNFVAGLYYFTSEYALEPQDVVNLGSLVQSLNASQELDAYAVFAEAYYQISDSWRLTLGGRYTQEEKEFARNGTDAATGELFVNCPDPASPVPACADPIEDWNQFSPRVSVDYVLSDDIMFYFSYAEGFRSGGWSGRANAANEIGPYDPETLGSFELGVRSDWLDQRLRLNATAFYMDYQDKQEDVTVSFTSPDGTITTSSFVENAASADIEGLEFELYFQATEALTIRSAVGLLDADYADYDVVDGGVEVSLLDTRHYRFAPDVTFNLGGDYTFSLGAADLVITANYKYTDEFWVTPAFDLTGNDRDLIESYETFDLSIAYIADHFTVSLWGNDLTHEEGRLFRKFDAGAFWFGDQEAGRSFGLNVMVEF